MSRQIDGRTESGGWAAGAAAVVISLIYVTGELNVAFAIGNAGEPFWAYTTPSARLFLFSSAKCRSNGVPALRIAHLLSWCTIALYTNFVLTLLT